MVCNIKEKLIKKALLNDTPVRFYLLRLEDLNLIKDSLTSEYLIGRLGKRFLHFHFTISSMATEYVIWLQIKCMSFPELYTNYSAVLLTLLPKTHKTEVYNDAPVSRPFRTDDRNSVSLTGLCTTHKSFHNT